MHSNKNNIKEGDFVEYIFLAMNDTFNGSQGDVLEIIDEPEAYAIMAKVKWTDGTINIVPVNNLFQVESYFAKAA